jgi:ATP-dependent DNA ligase
MTAIAPMLLGRAAEIPDGNPRFLLEPKADGVRVMLHSDRKRRLRLLTRHGTDVTFLLDRIDARLEQVSPATILDGELVALARRPDGKVGCEFDAVMSELLRPHGGGERLHLMMFDCVKHRGADLDIEPWEARQGHLQQVATKAALPVVPVFECRPAIFDHLVSLGMEGVVVKERAGRYHPGRRCRTWRKHKARNETRCLVLGAPADRSSGRIERIAVREPIAGVVSWARVFSDQHRAQLRVRLGGTEPIAVRVAFTYRSPAGRLREARLLAVDG